MAMVTAGMVASAGAALEWSELMAPALFTIGLGQGLTLPKLTRTVVDRVRGRWAQLATGLVNSVLQISGTLAVALIGGLFYAIQARHAAPGAAAHGAELHGREDAGPSLTAHSRLSPCCFRR